MTKEQLKEYRYMIMNIERLEEQLMEIDTRLTKTTKPLSDMPKNITPRDMTNDLLARRIDLQNLISKKLSKAYASCAFIEEVIERMPEKEKLLMRLRYIKGSAWKIICIKMNYSWRQVHNIHKKALQLLEDKECTQLHTLMC